jgi:hypothetical protein
MMVGHAFYGKMNIPNDDTDIGGGDFEITVFGADGQQSLGGDTFRYGWAPGALFSIDSDSRSWAASGGGGGGTVAVAVDVNSIMIDYFLGGYLSIEPNDHFRLFVGAGPLLIWAQHETEPDASAPEYVNASSESEFGAGLYARTGLDIFLTKQFGFTAGARITDNQKAAEYLKWPWKRSSRGCRVHSLNLAEVRAFCASKREKITPISVSAGNPGSRPSPWPVCQ